MKKLFLLIPALVLCLVTNAANVISITPTSPHSADNLRRALLDASDGDVIVMDNGVYEESNSNYIAFDAKSVTVKAADGANVIIKPHVPFTVSGGARAEIQGVKIDASELCSLSSYSHLMYASDDAANNRLILDGCEVYGYTVGKAVIASRGSNKLDSLIINNCKFYNHTTRSCVYLENTENKGLIITNSTFYNIATGTVEFSAGIIDDRNASAKVRVDHCTFYNVVAQNTDYAAVGKIAISDGIVSNSIFMLPENVDGERAIRGLAQANNCLTYNYIKDSNWGIHSSSTKTNCINEKDPLFANAASGDFTLANNWVTMNISPAIGAGTDGSDLGDPRWHTAGTLPTTDFASPYVLLGEKSLLSGSFALNGDNYIQSQNQSVDGVAIWKLHIERQCAVQVMLNIDPDNGSGHRYELELFDAENNAVGSPVAEAADAWTKGDQNLGSIVIPAAGDYKIRLSNHTSHSSTILQGVTLTYLGGAVQAMPGTTAINEAWFSANGTRTGGAIEYTSVGSGCWAKWNIAVANHAWYDVVVNIKGQYGHDFTVEFLKEGETTPIVVTKGETNYTNDLTLYANDLGLVELEAANYEMKVSNSVGDAAIISVTLAYSGGNVINVSPSDNTTLPVADAWFTNTCTRADGKIEYTSSNATSWIKWNIATSTTAFYDITVNIDAPNAHEFAVAIYEDESAAPIASIAEDFSDETGTPLSLSLGRVNLAGDKNYVVKVTNTPSGSKSKVNNVVFAPVVSSAISLPGTLDPNDAVLSDNARVSGGELYFGEGDPGDFNPVGQYAQWEVTVDHSGTFLFTMAVSSTLGQSYKITILNSSNEEVDSYDKKPGSGAKTIAHYFNIEAGDYFVKVENSYPWSDGHVVSLVVTEPSILTIDETAETNSIINDNYRDGTHDIKIIRTIVKDMYNTICLPFDVSSSELPAMFGSDVELKQMSSATISGTVLDLNFDDATSIYRGTPYLIKTSKTIVNPTFIGVEIKEKVGQATSGDNADFIGTFIKSEVPAGENNLFLGPNDLLYFSSDATPIKGMRAYFQVKGNASAISRARIVAGGQVATEINLVETQNESLQKVIENGQLVIIRDGVRYNALGNRMK